MNITTSLCFSLLPSYIGHTAAFLSPSMSIFSSVQRQVFQFYLEQLNSNNSKHELQKTGDQHDVADRLNGHYDALNYMLR